MRKLLLLGMLSWSSFAQVKYTEKGQPAEFTGYLFSPDKEKEARQAILDVDFFKTLGDSRAREATLYKVQIGELNNQINLYQESNKKLFEQATQNNKGTFWNGFLYFMAGAIVTTAITYSVNR